MKAVAHTAASVSMIFPRLDESLAFGRLTVGIRGNIRSGAFERVQSRSREEEITVPGGCEGADV